MLRRRRRGSVEPQTASELRAPVAPIAVARQCSALVPPQPAPETLQSVAPDVYVALDDLLARHGALAAKITEAIRSAVVAEREACATLAARYCETRKVSPVQRVVTRLVADAIRERGEIPFDTDHVRHVLAEINQAMIPGPRVLWSSASTMGKSGE